MAAKVFELLGKIGLEGANEVEKDLDDVTDKAEESSNSMLESFKKIGGAIAAAFALDKIKDFGVEIVNVAAEVAAEEAAFTQIMGDYSDQASEKMNKIAESTGMVDTRLKPYMTSMTAKFKGLGYDVDEATDLASTGLNIAADAAAFWDKSLGDSMSALNSFVNGSYEGGESIGLFANETTLADWSAKNLGLTWKDLTDKEKQFARLQFAKAMQEASGAAGQASKESGAFQNVLGNLQEGVRQFKAEIGEPILNNLVLPAMQKLADYINNTVRPGFQNLKETIVENKDTFILVGKVIAGVGVAIGSLIAGMTAYKLVLQATLALEKAQTIGKGLLALATGKVTGAQIKAAAAQMGLNTAMLLSPITWIVAGIVALVAILVVVYNKSEAFRNAVNQLWGALKNGLMAVFEELKPVLQEVVTALSELWDAIWTGLKPAIDWVVEKVKQYMPYIKAVVSTTIGTIVTAIKNLVVIVKTVILNVLTVVKTGINNIKIVIQTFINVVKGIFKVFTSVLKGDWKGAWEAIKNIGKSVMDGLKKIFTNSFNGFKNIVKNSLSGIKSFFSNTWNNIKSSTSKIWNGIRDSVTKPVRQAMDKVKEYINKIKGFFTNFTAKIKLPHFKIKNASLNPKDWITKGIPKLSVEWYKEGGILKQPTVFDYNPTTATARVGGEAGDEAVAPIDTLLGYVQTAVRNENSNLIYTLQRIYDILAALLPNIAEGMQPQLVLDGDVLAAKIAPRMDAELGARYNRKARY